MRTRLVLAPGSRGTRKLLTEYGRRLVCVRYRYDERLTRRWKTVELIVDEADWEPKPPRPGTLVKVKVRYKEETLRRSILQAGGRYDGKYRVWKILYKKAVELGLQTRIIRR
jgi:hypothetical protein